MQVASKGLPVSLEFLDRMETLEISVELVTLALLELKVQLAPMDCLGHQDCLDSPDLLDQLDKKETVVFLVSCGKTVTLGVCLTGLISRFMYFSLFL